MDKALKSISLALLFGLILALAPAGARAQDARDLMRMQQQGQGLEDVMGNVNPFETEGEQPAEEPADTTRKIRKPLESYFFSDSIRALPNFAWNISRDYNRVQVQPLDTTLLNWHIDYPFYRRGVGDAALGGLGQASEPLNYFERPEQSDFQLATPYAAYIYDMENVPFYNLKKPYFNFTYLESGQKRVREEHFELTLGHNITPSTGFSLNYRARGTKGHYDWSRTKNHNLAIAFNHTGKRYTLHAGYVNNHIEARENGGVVGEWAIRDTVFEKPSGVPMRLAGAQAENIYRNNAFFLEQSYAIPLVPLTEYDFSVADLPAVYVGHSFEYNAWSRTYTDIRAPYINERGHKDDAGRFIPDTVEYYKNWYINPQQTRDSLYERVISNRVFVQAQPWDRNGVVGTINGGVGLDLHTYSQFALGDYVAGRRGKVSRTSFFAYGSIEGKIKKYVDWGADLRFYPSGYRSGDLRIGARLALTGYLRGHPLVLEGRFSMEKRSAGYFEENLFSNHYAWFSPLRKENETRFEVALRVPDYAFEVTAWQGVVTDKIYYDADSHVAQHDGSVSLTSVYARKDFRIGGFHLDHRVLLQWSTNQQVVPVPLFSAFLSYYYEFWVKRDIFRLQVGLDGRYNTSYHAQGWNPSLGVFYNQREVETGNYPYLDFFVAGKWKRMRIFLKYQHLNKGLFGNDDYFAVAKYPLNPGMFKMGISWGFYD